MSKGGSLLFSLNHKSSIGRIVACSPTAQFKSMKRAILGVILGTILAGCNSSDNDQISVGNNESSESPNFGSATDIARGDGTERSTNALNYADDGHGGPPNREAGNYEGQPLPGQALDEELAKKIKVALTTGSMGTTGVIAADQLTKIQVQVRNGVVTLSGPVSTEDEKQDLQKRVEGMKGVQSVQNNLTVGARNLQDTPLQPRVPRTPGNQ